MARRLADSQGVEIACAGNPSGVCDAEDLYQVRHIELHLPVTRDTRLHVRGIVVILRAHDRVTEALRPQPYRLGLSRPEVHGRQVRRERFWRARGGLCSVSACLGAAQPECSDGACVLCGAARPVGRDFVQVADKIAGYGCRLRVCERRAVGRPTLAMLC